tara:strand:+ start:2410 stop:2844 length:435 start_codon:yes stop_codon:yes gene_type:complete
LPSVNYVELIGNVGKDPEVMTFANGGKVIKFTVATSKSWKNKETGEKQQKTCWHNIQAPVREGGPGWFAEQYVRKGDLVRIVGEIDNSKSEKDGVTRYFSSINIPAYDGKIDKFFKHSDDNAPANQSAAPNPDTDIPLDDDIPF